MHEQSPDCSDNSENTQVGERRVAGCRAQEAEPEHEELDEGEHELDRWHRGRGCRHVMAEGTR